MAPGIELVGLPKRFGHGPMSALVDRLVYLGAATQVLPRLVLSLPASA